MLEGCSSSSHVKEASEQGIRIECDGCDCESQQRKRRLVLPITLEAALSAKRLALEVTDDPGT